ncbi:transposase [Dyella japonica]|uniref:Transposase n=1 Tax=Dyella japonica TaxID=231455 RepID=A0ABV2K0X3_9GAMM
MSTQWSTVEFKEDAVRQVVGRGHSVAEVAVRLGVSTYSLYQWVRAMKPDKTEQQAAELNDEKSEILRLRAQLRRVEKERDFVRRSARYFPKEPE